MSGTQADRAGYRPIADYGIIGDTRGLALVNSEGGIDWCALPYLDSPPVFLKILDAERGGSFQIRPVSDHYAVERRYIDESNVLVTRFVTPTGTIELADCFTVPATTEQEEEPPHEILRLVSCTRGTVDVTLHCHVTPDYARKRAECHRQSPSAVRWTWDGGELWMAGNWPFRIDEEAGIVSCSMTLHTGDRLAVTVSDTKPDTIDPGVVRSQINDAVNFWRAWVSGCPYFGMYRERVIRSALTLKLLTFRPTGALIAAATTSLPEQIGGVRNWDYRFTWIRDAALTLWSFSLIGFYSEMHEFMGWVRDRIEQDGADIQIMYGIHGESDLTEHTLDHLSGYRNSRPVRIGNAAYKQRQLDIYGEILDTAYLFYDVWEGMERLNDQQEKLSGRMWEALRLLAERTCEVWMEKDNGLWETRGGPQHFVHSKVMCWVALQRAVLLAKHFNLPGDVERWARTRDEIRKTVIERGYNEEVGAFTQAFDSDALDASVLLLPMVHFIKGDDPKMIGTIQAIRDRLSVDGLVYRYLTEDTDDGLPVGEGTFTICSFWMVDNLVFCGRIDEARELFARLLGYANDLGLYSEEIDPANGEFLGNFPQAFTHMALINAAVNLDKAQRRIVAGIEGPVRPGVRARGTAD